METSRENDTLRSSESLKHTFKPINADVALILAKLLDRMPMRLPVRIRAAGLLGMSVGSPVLAPIISIGSLADPGVPGTSSLRDAIAAANTSFINKPFARSAFETRAIKGAVYDLHDDLVNLSACFA